MQINQNESEADQIQFWFLLMDFIHHLQSYYFTTDPIEISQLIPKIWAEKGLQKQ